MSLPLTPAQQDCLDAIKALTRNEVPPSYAQLQTRLGLRSRSGVHRLLHGLKGRGHIDFDYGVPRSIRILNPDNKLSNLPTDTLVRMRRQIDTILQGRAQ